MILRCRDGLADKMLAVCKAEDWSPDSQNPSKSQAGVVAASTWEADTREP